MAKEWLEMKRNVLFFFLWSITSNTGSHIVILSNLSVLLQEMLQYLHWCVNIKEE